MTKSGKNKGEASELYALLSVLRDRGIYAADENLEKDESRFYPVTKIFTSDISENSSHFVIENGESFAVKGSTKIDSISQNNLEKDVEEIYLVLNTNTDKGTLNYDFDILKERYPDANILFVGAKGHMEEQLVPKAGFELQFRTSQQIRKSTDLPDAPLPAFAAEDDDAGLGGVGELHLAVDAVVV